MEELVLTDPVVVPGTTTTKYKVRALTLDWEMPSMAGPGLVAIQLRDDLGGTLFHQYQGKAATDFIKWMNTANFTTTSMHKKILQRLSNDGVIPGTVTGAPDPPPADF